MSLFAKLAAPLKPHLDKIGAGGSIFAALCCLGFPAFLSVLSAVGLGFLINDKILMPLLVVFLLITLYGLYRGKQRHGQPQAFWLGIISAVVTFGFIFVAFVYALAVAGIVGLTAAAVWNIVLQSHADKCATDNVSEAE